MPAHSTNVDPGVRLFIEKPEQLPSHGDSRGEILRFIKKTSELSAPLTTALASRPVRLYFPERKGYARTVDLTIRYVEQTGKFRENEDQEVFLQAKSGDPLALGELISRAVRRKEAYVIWATRSLSSRDPDFEPASVISFCLCKVLGPDNLRFRRKIASARNFFGGFHRALKNRITDGYRKLGIRPMVLTDSQIGTEGDERAQAMENLANEHGLYATEDRDKKRLVMVLRVAIVRCLNEKESEHLRLYAEGLSTQDRMEHFGFGSINATDLSIMRIKTKLKGYIRKHPELFDL